MHPAGRFQNRTRRAAALVELGITAISVGLEDSTVIRQMRLRMFTRAVGKEIIPPRGIPAWDKAEPAYRFGYGARSYYGKKYSK